jgi:hypothetical protein
MANRDNYWWRIAKSWDQLINAHTGGDEDETISSRMGKAVEGRTGCWFCRVVCKVLHWIDPNHCQDSIERDEGLDK